MKEIKWFRKRIRCDGCGDWLKKGEARWWFQTSENEHWCARCGERRGIEHRGYPGRKVT